MNTEAITIEHTRNEAKIYTSPSIYTKWRKAKLLDAMVKENEKFLTTIKGEIKEFMEDHGILVDGRGVPLVTWQIQKKPRNQNFDFEAFINDYPDLYEKYAYKHPDNLMRVFRLK